MVEMTVKVNKDQQIVEVSGAGLLGYADSDLLGQQIDTIIPDRHKAGHHGGFYNFQSTGTKKIIGSWLQLPALTKSGAEKVVDLVLTEQKADDGSHNIIAFLK